MRRWTAIVVVSATLFGGCRSGGDPHHVVLDGRPRRPDAEGVVEMVSVKRLRLDGGREYAVSDQLQSFSTYTLELTPLLSRRNQYVQIGVSGKTVTWLAGVGAVVRAPGHPPTVYYAGTVKTARPGVVVFRDGTVLRLGDSVHLPPSGRRVQVEIDPVVHRVRSIAVMASGN